MGAFRKTWVRLSDSQALGSIPAVLPRRYTFSPISITSGSILAPAALTIWSVAAMISGPIPSPYATVIAVVFAICRNHQNITWGFGGEESAADGPGRDASRHRTPSTSGVHHEN